VGDPSVDKAADVSDSHLRGRLLEIKCEYLCLTSVRNGGNIRYIREETHIHNILRFWLEM
jgi:hypothetical protein